MSRVEAALDRLPWLADAPEIPRTRALDVPLAPWIVVMMGVLAVAGLIDIRSGMRDDEDRLPTSTTTIHLPPARIIEPPVAVRTQAATKLSSRNVQLEFPPASPSRPREVSRPKVAASNRHVPTGRTIQVGAFGSARQAEDGLRYMHRHYPGDSGFPSSVRTSRNSKGRSFYRFQMSTPSQAHSEVLCQRMRRIGLSCEVVGVPRKANSGR